MIETEECCLHCSCHTEGQEEEDDIFVFPTSCPFILTVSGVGKDPFTMKQLNIVSLKSFKAEI